MQTRFFPKCAGCNKSVQGGKKVENVQDLLKVQARFFPKCAGCNKSVQGGKKVEN